MGIWSIYVLLVIAITAESKPRRAYDYGDYAMTVRLAPERGYNNASDFQSTPRDDISKANVSSGELQHDAADQFKQWFAKQSASVHDIAVPKIDKVAYYAVEKITELPVSFPRSQEIKELKNSKITEGNDELNKTNHEKFELLVTENQLQDALNGLLKSVIRQKNSVRNATNQEDYEHNQRNVIGSVNALKETLASIVSDTNVQGSLHSQTDPPRNPYDGNEKIRISIIPDAREKLSDQRGLTLEIVGKK